MMEELGSGFYLAMHDLEIRGAGEVLGENQCGEMQEVGFQLYNDMLTEAVRSLKAGQRARPARRRSASTTEINLHAPALLPDDYCGDVHERLSLYKRLANCETRRASSTRCSRSSSTASASCPSRRARCSSATGCASPRGRSAWRASTRPHEAVQLQFMKNPPLDGAKVIDFIRKKRRDARLAGPDKLRVDAKLPAWQERAQAVKDILQELAA